MSGPDKVPMLLDCYLAMEIELKQLKNVTRHEIIKAIEEARAHGDLKENAEYHAAKDQQGLTEARIKIIDSAITLAEVIDPSKLSGNRILFGATVTIIDEEDNSVTYQVVGDHETDVKMGRISHSSPLGRSLIGRELGEEIEVTTPKGTIYYEVSKVEFI